jgi:hypothetical protein
MNPSVDDRLASVVRALTDVIMPSLKSDASLAQEQMQLIIGHLQILRAQLDGSPGFEAEEAQDARALGDALVKAAEGGPETQAALVALRAALAASASPREERVAVHTAIDKLVRAAAADGTGAFRTELGGIIIAMQTPRTMKDRAWFTMMGFDAGI